MSALFYSVASLLSGFALAYSTSQEAKRADLAGCQSNKKPISSDYKFWNSWKTRDISDVTLVQKDYLKIQGYSQQCGPQSSFYKDGLH